MEFSIWQKVVLNTILASIPEEIYIVLFIVIMLKRFNVIESTVDNSLIKISSSKVKKLLAGIVLIALILNIMRYNGVKIIIIITITSIVLHIILITIIYRMYSIKKIMKISALTFIAMFTIAIMEVSYGTFLLNITQITGYQLNANIFYNFLFSIPERLMMVIIIYLMHKDFNNLKSKLIKPIIESKYLLSLTTIILIINSMITIILVISFGFSKFLYSFDLMWQIPIVGAVIVFPIVFMLLYLYIIYKYFNRKKEI